MNCLAPVGVAQKKWGVWGIGPVHELFIYQSSIPKDDIQFEADVHAVLIGRRTSQEIEVWIGRTRVASWAFVPGKNRGVRPPGIKVEFRPMHTESPMELDPTLLDQRALGLGVLGMRSQAYDRLSRLNPGVARCYGEDRRR